MFLFTNKFLANSITGQKLSVCVC